MKSKDKAKIFGLGMLAGSLVGYVGSLYISHKTQKQHKELLESLVKAFSDKNERKRIEKAFQDYTDESIEKYRATKQHFLEKLSELGDTIKSLDKKGYLKILTQSIKESAKQQQVSSRDLAKLKKLLESDYKRIKKVIKE